MNPLIERHFFSAGRFSVDGVGLDRLIAVGGTPQYAYSARLIRTRFNHLQQNLPDVKICYSVKANPNPAIIRLLGSCGAGAEISSAGELRAALDAGIAPNDIVWVGPAKTSADIRLAVESRIYAVVVDWPGELEWLEAAAAGLEQPVRALLRINTRETRPEAKEVMVGGPSKFGFDEETVIDEVGSLRLHNIRIAGIQVYSASQVLDADWLAGHLEYVGHLAEKISSGLGIELECVDFGGGFGIPYNESQQELDLARVAAVWQKIRRGSLAPDRCRAIIESGRWLVAEAGVFLTRVIRIKHSRGRSFIITDGGFNAFSRPVVMRIPHPARLVSRPAMPPAGSFDICGPICTPLDCIGRDIALPEPEPGDCIGFFCAGAYGRTMSLVEFMSVGRPAEVLCTDGSAVLIRPPEP